MNSFIKTNGSSETSNLVYIVEEPQALFFWFPSNWIGGSGKERGCMTGLNSS